MDYDIKKGWMKNIEGDLLPKMMEEVFGNVQCQGDKFVSSYGVMAKIEVTIVSRDKMDITVENISDLQSRYSGAALDEAILDSKRKLNVFAEKATGFNAKARMKRAQDKAKKGLA